MNFFSKLKEKKIHRTFKKKVVRNNNFKKRINKVRDNKKSQKLPPHLAKSINAEFSLFRWIDNYRFKDYKRKNPHIISGFSENKKIKKLNRRTFYHIFLYLGTLYFCLNTMPNKIWDPELKQITILIAAIGIWRYTWWFNHYLRSEIYHFIVFPRLRKKADFLWEKHKKNQRFHFMMTTYKENIDTTRRVMKSICDNIRSSGADSVVWLGSADPEDEFLLAEYIRFYGGDLPITLNIIRQYGSGKRQAIGLVLRAMSRADIDNNDLVVFMDGDSILGEKVIEKCAGLFFTDSELQAVTTDEEVVCFGPKWMVTWLTMRFAQRRVAMQSHSLSKKVLTLTGRMTVYRAFHVKNEQFIQLLEADFLEHWLWGRFKFLSGDDKSTWYYMLLKGARLLYVPDATIYTVEYVEGSAVNRMLQNFRRWSGNMLRNGSRAIALGPRKVGLFIWWCVVDQRISMWTMLVSPILAISASFLISPWYIVGYFMWIALSRFFLSIFLWRYSDKIYLSYPLLLYVNQLINSALKVYSVFRLSKQRWANRGDQTAGFSEGKIEYLRNLMANWITLVWVLALFIVVIIYTGILEPLSYFGFLTLFS